jgi:putative SOS response-associated peptidase YedK
MQGKVMCGRFVRDLSVAEIANEFEVEEPDFDIPPSYNVAPGQEIVVVINDGKKRLTSCKWGFVPSWSKDASAGYKMINARAETVSEKPSFRNAFKSGRTLVIASGFYEWKKEGKTKIPFHIYQKSERPFGMAGLYSMWKSPEGIQVCTCTIITTDANSLLEPVHNRMPVIIHKQDEYTWLDRTERDSEKLLSFLKPFPSEEISYHSVSSMVNSPRNDSPDCIRAV